MSNDKNFVDGLIVKRNDNAPDFVICNLSIKVEDLKGWLDRNDEGSGWINVKVNRSQGGKLYAERDTWKPKQTNPNPYQQEQRYNQPGNQGVNPQPNTAHETERISQPPNFEAVDPNEDDCPF